MSEIFQDVGVLQIFDGRPGLGMQFVASDAFHAQPERFQKFLIKQAIEVLKECLKNYETGAETFKTEGDA
jgi:hypothetical protein